MGIVVLAVSSAIMFGRKPAVRDVLCGFVLAFIATGFLVALTTIMNVEGNHSLLPLFFGGCVWLVIARLPNTKMGCSVCFGLGIVFLLLNIHHLFLATSKDYTDNPQARISGRHRKNLHALHEHKPLESELTASFEWHTLITHLYRVKPIESPGLPH